MYKFIIVIVLIVLAIVIAAAITKKSVFKFVRDLNIKNSIPVANLGNKLHDNTNDGFATIVVPNLELYQLNADGTSFFMHPISKREMCNEDGEMIGLSISHPGADCDGLKLHGKKKKDGSFDDKDPGTYAALTVNTGAVRIGFDEKGFYGEVTNANARVYEVVDDKKTKQVQYGEQFNITDQTYILIGNQWLYFAAPSLPAFPGAKIAGNNDEGFSVPEATVHVPTAKLQKPVGMKKREAFAKKARSNLAFVQGGGASIRFPADE